MFKIKITISFLMSLFLTNSQVQELDNINEIKSISLKSNISEYGLPILGLNERLFLEFDVLNSNEDDFYYVIEHYNFDWTKSRLMKSEFLEGLDNLRIFNYENSFNTYQIYSNYKLQIPNKQTRLRVSGNYLIKIFNDYNELVFSRKFMVYENLAKVKLQIKRSRNVNNINSKQTVDFFIKTSSNNFRFNNPIQTVNTIILQNNNLKTAISGIKPQYTLGNELIYRYNMETAFSGGNEYLYFENKDVRGTNLGVQYTYLQEIYHSHLYADINRSKTRYTYNPDINGGFKVALPHRKNLSVQADYRSVH